MKKLITMFLALSGIIAMTSCSNKETYKLTIIDSNNFIYDKPKEQYSYFASGDEIKLHSYPIMDADLVMYVDGEFYSKQKDIETDDGYIWEYTFTMPIGEATLEFKVEGGI